MGPPVTRRGDRGQPQPVRPTGQPEVAAPAGAEPDRQEAARALQQQLIGFKRTLHLIRTGSGLHLRTTAAGVPVLGILRRCGPLRTTAIAAGRGLDLSLIHI